MIFFTRLRRHGDVGSSKGVDLFVESSGPIDFAVGRLAVAKRVRPFDRVGVECDDRMLFSMLN